MSKKSDIIVINIKDFDINNMIFGSFKENNNYKYIDLKYKINNKKKPFYIQSSKLLFKNELGNTNIKNNYISLYFINEDFYSFIKGLEIYILETLSENSMKIFNKNYNYNDLEEFYISNVSLDQEKINISLNMDNLIIFDHNKNEISIEQLQNIEEETFIYIIFDISKIIFNSNNNLYLDINIHQIRLYKEQYKPPILTNYNFDDLETCMETQLNLDDYTDYNPELESYIKNEKTTYNNSKILHKKQQKQIQFDSDLNKINEYNEEKSIIENNNLNSDFNNEPVSSNKYMKYSSILDNLLEDTESS